MNGLIFKLGFFQIYYKDRLCEDKRANNIIQENSCRSLVWNSSIEVSLFGHYHFHSSFID